MPVVSWRHWYLVKYWSSKCTNMLLSPWPLSCHCHQEGPCLQAIMSLTMHKEQSLAVVIFCLAIRCCSFLLNSNALKWCVWCSGVDLPVLFTKSCTTVPDERGHFRIFVPEVQTPSGTASSTHTSRCLSKWRISMVPKIGSLRPSFVYFSNKCSGISHLPHRTCRRPFVFPCHPETIVSLSSKRSMPRKVSKSWSSDRFRRCCWNFTPVATTQTF